MTGKINVMSIFGTRPEAAAISPSRNVRRRLPNNLQAEYRTDRFLNIHDDEHS